MWIRFLMALGAVTLTAGLASSCGDDAGQETLCKPGEEIFCKCRGGYQGTKTCLASGEAFGECTTFDGPCPEIPETTSSNASSSASSGGGGGGTGTKQLFEPCESASECATSACENGYCTRSCDSYEECGDDAADVYGDCVIFPGGAKVCAPYCTTQSECTDYGPQSGCNGAPAFEDPDYVFAVCGNWGSALVGMPYGTLCEDGTLIYADQLITAECNLGASGAQNVCLFGECSKACYAPSDCPQNDCTSNGSAPGCCSSEPDCN